MMHLPLDAAPSSMAIRSYPMKQKLNILATAVAAAFVMPIAAYADTATGPSSSQSPYVVNVPADVKVISILTVGDSVNTKPGSSTPDLSAPGTAAPYRMVGIPDGLGAFDNYGDQLRAALSRQVLVGERGRQPLRAGQDGGDRAG
jgi:hypothetical protein